MKVRELMTTNVTTAGPRTNAAQVAEILWSADCGAAPVVDEKGKLEGIVTDRDLCIALGTRNKRPSEISASEIMARELVTCGPDDDAKRALSVMHSRKVRRLPVVDKEGKLRGIISLNDLLRVATTNGEISHSDLIAALRSIGEHARTTPAGTPRPTVAAR